MLPREVALKKLDSFVAIVGDGNRDRSRVSSRVANLYGDIDRIVILWSIVRHRKTNAAERLGKRPPHEGRDSEAYEGRSAEQQPRQCLAAILGGDPCHDQDHWHKRHKDQHGASGTGRTVPINGSRPKNYPHRQASSRVHCIGWLGGSTPLHSRKNRSAKTAAIAKSCRPFSPTAHQPILVGLASCASRATPSQIGNIKRTALQKGIQAGVGHPGDLCVFTLGQRNRTTNDPTPHANAIQAAGLAIRSDTAFMRRLPIA